VRLVDAGERLVLRVLEQAGRAHRQRKPHDLEERREIAHHGVRQRRGEEPPPDLLLVGHVDREIAQVVALEEFVEDVGADHDRGWNGDAHPLEPLGDLVLAEQIVHEREATRLAAERPAADA
jgi:hypothetical protein